LADRTTTRTDADGHYEVLLPKAGGYRVKFSQEFAELMDQDRDATLLGGQNLLDWSLAGGVLHIYVDGWDGQQWVEMTIINDHFVFPGTMQVSMAVKPGDTPP
jgi:hypothetical protein